MMARTLTRSQGALVLSLFLLIVVSTFFTYFSLPNRDLPDFLLPVQRRKLHSPLQNLRLKYYYIVDNHQVDNHHNDENDGEEKPFSPSLPKAALPSDVLPQSPVTPAKESLEFLPDLEQHAIAFPATGQHELQNVIGEELTQGAIPAPDYDSGNSEIAVKTSAFRVGNTVQVSLRLTVYREVWLDAQGRYKTRAAVVDVTETVRVRYNDLLGATIDKVRQMVRDRVVRPYQEIE